MNSINGLYLFDICTVTQRRIFIVNKKQFALVTKCYIIYF